MSILFLPPSAGAASVPDASETISGKIRIATSAEATAGTNDLTAMTPAKTKSVVDAAIVGGVTYQGTFDASAPADLSNASKGDLYIISVAGTYQGQTWAVGDHLLINADMGGTLDPSKIDKVDNTDSVTSVAGRTGAVTLSTADISGLATVASTGAYSDLTGTPTLGTAAAEDVGTLAGNVVQLNGSAQLPAVDGSLLTGITASVAALDDIGDVTITSVANGEALIYNSTSGDWENGTVSASVAALDDIGDVNVTGAVNTNVLKYNSTSGDWESGAVAYSEVTGTPTLATVATTGAYSDLSGTPTNVSTFTNDAGYLTEAQTVVLQYNSTTTATAVSSKDLHVYRLYGAGGFTLTVSATAANGLVEINNISASACTISGPTFKRNGEGATGGVTSITVEAGERRVFYLEATSIWLEMNATLLDRLAGVSITSPANGEALIYNSTSGDWENGTVSASVAALNDIGDVSAAAPSNTNVIKYNSTSGDWESGAVAYSEVTGTPTLATVATTGAYSDLSGTPTLGTAAALDVGTSANNIVQLDGSGLLPAVDGSQLTNLPSGGSLPTVTTQTGNYTIPSRSAGQLNLTVIVNNGATAVTIDLPSISAGDVGFTIDVKVLGTGAVTVDAGANYIDDGSSTSVTISTQYDSRTFQAGSTTDWYII